MVSPILESSEQRNQLDGKIPPLDTKEESNSPRFDHSYILGTRVDVISLTDLLATITDAIRGGKRITVANLNIHAMDHAYKVNWFRDFTNSSDVVICDGYGIKLASKFFYGKDLYRYTHMDWFDQLADVSEKNGFSLYFLGTRQEVVEKAADVAVGNYPNLKIAGLHNGFFDKSTGSADNQAVIEQINIAHPDILIVGFGMPIQEKWLLENSDKIKTNVFITAGGFFDYLSGETKRAPRWMTDHGLEWLGRLLIDPVRLWKRYILGNPIFLWRILKHRILHMPLPFTTNDRKAH